MADVEYIDQSTGALTDGESFVLLGDTQIASGAANTTEILFESDTTSGGTENWSQYAHLFAMGLVGTKYAGNAWQMACYPKNLSTGASNLRFVANASPMTQLNTYTGINSGSLGYINGTVASGTNDSFYSAFYVWLLDINSAKNKTMMSQLGDPNQYNTTSAKGAMFHNVSTFLGQEPVTQLAFYISQYFKDYSRISLWGVLPRMVNPT